MTTDEKLKGDGLFIKFKEEPGPLSCMELLAWVVQRYADNTVGKKISPLRDDVKKLMDLNR